MIVPGSMIESGLYLWATTNPNITKFMGNADSQRIKAPTSFYYSFLPKQPVLPGIILDRLKSPYASETLDPGTRLPGYQIEGKFQLGSVDNIVSEGPAGSDGYLSCAMLSQALRRELLNLATGNATLPDGTIIDDVMIEDEYDAHYEVGGLGYLCRRVLLVTLLFKEIA